jgi:heme-degrading monooxygenase HmoA
MMKVVGIRQFLDALCRSVAEDVLARAHAAHSPQSESIRQSLLVLPSSGTIVFGNARFDKTQCPSPVQHGFAVLGVLMIVRLCKTQVQASRFAQYESWEKTRSLPMFKELEGCLGVLFLRSERYCFALSFWRDMAAVDGLETSTLYQQTSKAYEESGMLIGSAALLVFETVEGFAKEDLLDAVAGLTSSTRD